MFSKKDLELIGHGDDPDIVNQVIALDQKIDSFFGLRHQVVEQTIKSQNHEEYQGLSIEALQTSYLDYYQMFKLIGKDSMLVDIGAGYCRGTILAQHLDYKCISIEIVKERVEAARNLLKYPSEIIQTDICDPTFILPIANYYFLYLPQGRVLYQALKKIKDNHKDQVAKLIVIESHGDVVDYLKLQKNWLKEASLDLKTSSARHDINFYLFETICDAKNNQLQHHWNWNMNQNLELLICEELKTWTVDTYNSLIWNSEGEIYLETLAPRRIISFKNIRKQRKISEQEYDYQILRVARNKKVQTIHGYILKIYVDPEKKVEWLNSTFTSWQQALQLLESQARS